jgi:FkbM family methyltransferase
MTILAEIRSQIIYQRKLLRLLGWLDAIRFRRAMIAKRLGLSARTTIALHPSNLQHPVELRLASTDAEVYGQVIRDEEYAPVIDPAALTIVDCGANIGLTSAWFLSRLPQARVIAIEPFAANAQMCRRNLAAYGNRATVIEAAVWNRCTSLVLEYEGASEWAVRVRPAREAEAGDIEAIDIPSLHLDQIDILKVDIEGSEADLFAEGASAWLAHVRHIAIELHGPDCAARFFAALEGFDYQTSASGELTICKGLSKRRHG